jgi:hypothetical protein
LATQLQKMQWQAQRPKRVNFNSGVEYNRAVATWRASDPSKMEAIVPRETPAPTRTPTPPPVPTRTPTQPLIQPPQKVISPAQEIARQEIESAKNVKLAPTKTFTTVSPDVMDFLPEPQQFAPGAIGTKTPEPMVEPVSETPPSSEDVQQVLDRTSQRAAASEEEARRQLFYRGQVKRRGGMRMLFGKYAFPSPRQLAPATAEQLSKASSTVKKLVAGRLGGLVSPERASYLKESKKEGYMGLGGEESPYFRG